MTHAPARLSLVRTDSPDGLLARLVGQTPGAASELFHAFAPRIRALMRRLGLSAADAEDVVQECLLLVWHRAERVTHPDLLRPFVLGIAVNLARSMLRRRRWAQRLGLGPVATDPLEDVGDAAAPSDQDAVLQLRRVYTVLQSLRDELRIAFVLRFVDQLTLEEVAEVTGWSLATTKRKLARAQELFLARVKQDAMLGDRLWGDERHD